ncbi:MAG: hypothetical protein KDA55_13810, partial [Planctomycetales bacterium]|nr:hypothetical protein [Planctomycetales bacterium]
PALPLPVLNVSRAPNGSNLVLAWLIVKSFPNGEIRRKNARQNRLANQASHSKTPVRESGGGNAGDPSGRGPHAGCVFARR